MKGKVVEGLPFFLKHSSIGYCEIGNPFDAFSFVSVITREGFFLLFFCYFIHIKQFKNLQQGTSEDPVSAASIMYNVLYLRFKIHGLFHNDNTTF